VANTDPSDVPTRTAVLEHPANATDRALEVLNQRFDQLNHRLDQMNDQMNGRMDQHLRWIITTVITTAFAIVGANVGILTLLLRGH
jgi:hypothetical protein